VIGAEEGSTMRRFDDFTTHPAGGTPPFRCAKRGSLLLMGVPPIDIRFWATRILSAMAAALTLLTSSIVFAA
jgi:hypothetical protein